MDGSKCEKYLGDLISEDGKIKENDQGSRWGGMLIAIHKDIKVISHRELIPAMARKFTQQGDIDLALRCINEADGVNRTKKLAAIHAEKAMDAVVKALEPSPYRDSLIHLARRVVDRSK